MAIIGFGNALTDILVQLPDENILRELSLERGGMYLIDHTQHQQMMSKISHLPQRLVSGGSAANMVSGVASLGTPAAYIGQIGNDPTGEAFRSHQQSKQITPLLGISATTPSGKCISMIHPDGERTMLTYLGAALEVGTQQLTPSNLKSQQILFIEGYLLNSPGVIQPAMRAAKDAGVLVALDAASFTVIRDYRAYADCLIDQYVDILFANEDEAAALTDSDSPRQALESLAPRCSIVIIKTGPNGSLIAHRQERYQIGTLQAQPIDKTGAGDLYAAGFLHGLAQGLSLRQCGEIGAVVSSKSIEVLGAQLPNDVWDTIRPLVTAIESGQSIVPN